MGGRTKVFIKNVSRCCTTSRRVSLRIRIFKKFDLAQLADGFAFSPSFGAMPLIPQKADN